MFCRGCGNEIPDGEPCAICEDTRRHVPVSRRPTHLCPSCGNEVLIEEPCGVCESGRASRRRGSAPEAGLCRRCGNEVQNVHECEICQEGRGGKTQEVLADPTCPRCSDPLERQDWEGVVVHCCPTCQGCMFEPGGLEATLNRLRETSEATDLQAVLHEFRDRPRGALPRAVRYKECPFCGQNMSRRNYAGVSGVIIEQCHHGTWIDQPAFVELTDFVTRGGDVFAARSPLRRKR